MEELIVRIENVLRYGKGERPADDKKDEIKIGKYTFHLSRQTLKDNGDERKLSFRESELLKLLYENKDKIIDRRDILNLYGAMITFSTPETWMFILPNFVVI